MPNLPMKACPVASCRELTTGGPCEYHRKRIQRIADKKRLSYSERGYNHRWHKIRKAYLSRNPLCVDCLSKLKTKAADVVHHIKPLDKGGTHKADNLQALCRECHESKHKRF